MNAPRMTKAQYEAYLLRRARDKALTSAGKSQLKGKTLPRVRREKKPFPWRTETEQRYYCGVLKSQGEYEAESITYTPEHLTGRDAHRYTPDYRSRHNGIVVYHEVKGSYRLGSQDAARLRWCMAAIARPDAVFVWSKERKDRRWDIEVWYDGGRTRLKERGVRGFSFGESGGVVWVK